MCSSSSSSLMSWYCGGASPSIVSWASPSMASSFLTASPSGISLGVRGLRAGFGGAGVAPSGGVSSVSTLASVGVFCAALRGIVHTPCELQSLEPAYHLAVFVAPCVEPHEQLVGECAGRKPDEQPVREVVQLVH